MSTKVQSLIKLLLVFVVSLLSFSVGTYVGFKFSENKYKLAVLEPHKAEKHAVADKEDDSSHSPEEGSHSQPQRDIASVKDNHDSENMNNEPMSDEEIAKLAEEFVSDDPAPAAPSKAAHSPSKPVAAAPHSEEPTHGKPAPHGNTPHEKHTPTPMTAPTKAPASAQSQPKHDSHDLTPPPSPNVAASAPKKVSAPVAPTPSNRIPQSFPPQQAFESAGKFTVQVSSFAAENEAKQKALTLKNQGYNAFYVPTEVKGKKWYRVSIGLFQTEREARSLRESFVKENPDSAAFIQRVPVE
jgi:cell division septation protein DedD